MTTIKTILIVDDDQTLRLTLSRYLQAQGFEVQSAASAEEGLALLEAAPPDLIISDILMPQMDGLKFCRHVRDMPTGKLIPFIFLSGRGELDERIEGHQTGADDYLVKPFHFRELGAKVQTQLERSQRIHDEIAQLQQQAKETVPLPKPLDLTPSEEKIFYEVIQGYTNKQIGDRLFVSPRTVQTHLSNILGKLKLVNRSQLVRFAFENGYRPPNSDPTSATR
jgi:DNA-binding NarL/FixJ family response regulator